MRFERLSDRACRFFQPCAWIVWLIGPLEILERGNTMELLSWAFSALVAAFSLALLWRWGNQTFLDAARRKYGFGSLNGVLLEEMAAIISAEEAWVRAQQERLRDWLLELESPRYEDMTPERVLDQADKAELQALCQITEENSSDPHVLVERLRSIGSNAVAQFVRFFTSSPDKVSVPYETLLQDACKHLGCRLAVGMSIHAMELALQRRAFETVVQQMPAEERSRFLTQLAAKTREPGLGREVAIGGGIVVANLSGFGLYLASSTALGAITSAIGIALPFAVYTGMSSTLAVLIGPVGWFALGTWVVHKLGKADPNKVIAGTLLIANVRQRLIAIRDEPVPYITHDLNSVLAPYKTQLEAVRSKMIDARRYRRADSDRVDVSSFDLPDRPNLSSDIKRVQHMSA